MPPPAWPPQTATSAVGMPVHRISEYLRLDHPIGDSGNSEFPEFPIRFRYHYLPYLNRPEPARLQRVPDLPQESLDPDPGLDSGRRGLVDTRSPGALIGGHALPRVHQERRIIDEVEQVTEPAGGIFSRPAVQLDLHLPYREVSRVCTRPRHDTGIHRRIFGHYILSLTDTLPPFPRCTGFPRLGVLRRLRPTRAFGRRRAYPRLPAGRWKT